MNSGKRCGNSEMKTKKDYFFCSPKLLQNIDQIKEIDSCLYRVQWKEEFTLEIGKKKYSHQAGYNKAFQARDERVRVYHVLRTVFSTLVEELAVETHRETLTKLFSCWYNACIKG